MTVSGYSATKANLLNSVSLPASISNSFLFSGSATTSVPAASSPLKQVSSYSTIAVTANSGVTTFIAQVNVTNDAATANGSGSAWTTVATVSMTSAGTSYVPLNAAYLAIQVNITGLSGGTAQAASVVGQSNLVASNGTIISNPSLTGIPQATAFNVAQSGIPVILPSSGSIGNNGALTLTTALPQIFPNCWMYFPAGAISSGSAAGVYFVQMSSTTAGVIYNNILTSGNAGAVGTYFGAPYIPASPIPFFTTGPGAYTQTTATNPNLVSLPIIGGSLGNNGILRYQAVYNDINNSNTKTKTIYFGGQQVAYSSYNGQVWNAIARSLRNLGIQNSQISINASSGSSSSDVGVNGSASTYTTVNTANTQFLIFTAYESVATDYTILFFDAQILPSN